MAARSIDHEREEAARGPRYQRVLELVTQNDEEAAAECEKRRSNVSAAESQRAVHLLAALTSSFTRS